MLSDVINLLSQACILGAEVLAILLLMTIIGGWAVLRWLPRTEVLRWPVFAPIFGIGLLSIIGVPLVLVDQPVSRWAVLLIVGGALLTTTEVVRHLRTRPGRRLLVAYLTLRWGRSIGLIIIPVIVSTCLISPWGHGDVRGIWGTSDYGAYWSVSEYLQDNGATHHAYENQATYYNPDIEGHIATFERMGSMVWLAFLSATCPMVQSFQAVNPAILATVVLMTALVQYWAEQEKIRCRWMFVLWVGYPFLYFLPYFSYASQASGVVLFVSGILLGHRSLQVVSAGRAGICAVAAAVLIAASILHYSSMALASVVFAALYGYAAMQRGRGSLFVASGLVALALCAYYLPRTAHELLWANRFTWGWDWRGIIGSLEFIGLRSVLGFSMPEARGSLIRLLDAVLALTVLCLLWHGLVRSRLRLVALTLCATTGLLAGAASVRLFQHIPCATHTLVKVISTFAVFLLLLIWLPLLHRFEGLRSPWWRGVAAVFAGLFAIGHLAAIARSEPRPTYGSLDVVRLARRVVGAHPDTTISLALGAPPWLAAAIVRDSRRLTSSSSSDHVLIASADHLAEIPPARIVDREGPFIAVLTD